MRALTTAAVVVDVEVDRQGPLRIRARERADVRPEHVGRDKGTSVGHIRDRGRCHVNEVTSATGILIEAPHTGEGVRPAFLASLSTALGFVGATRPAQLLG